LRIDHDQERKLLPLHELRQHQRMQLIIAGHRPFTVVGDRQRWTGCNLAFHFADRCRNPASASNWNVMRCSPGLPRR
jgi:hypothetical protein